MANVVSFDPAKLPTASTTPPKHDEETLAAYQAEMNKGKAAGDGVAYDTSKDAKSAANSIKRSLRKIGAASTRTRVWANKEGKFQFALTWNEVPLTGNAAAQAAKAPTA